MKSEKIIFVLFLLVVLLSISGVGAVNVDNTTVQTSDVSMGGVADESGDDILAGTDDNIVTNETFHNYFDEFGFLRNNVTSDELIFEGDFNGLGVNYITIYNKSITLNGSDAFLDGISFVIESDDVTVDGFSMTQTDAMGIQACGDNIVISNNYIDFTALEGYDSYAIYSLASSNLKLLNNTILYVGNTDGTYVNNAVRIEGDGEEKTPATSIMVSGNTFELELPSVDVVYDEDTWESEVMSEGIVFYYCEDLKFTDNFVNLKYNSHSSAYGYDTLYAVSVRSDAYSFGTVQSSDILIVGNTIELEGYGCAYGVYVCADEFEIRENNIIVTADAYLAHGIDVDGPSANGAVVGNEINVESPLASYGIYSYARIGAVEGLSVIDNTISADGHVSADRHVSADNYASAGIELKVTDPVVTDNDIVINGNYTYGIIASVIVDGEGGVISGNEIAVLGSNRGDATTGDSFMTKNSIGISVKGTSLIEGNTIQSTNIGINLVEAGEFTINENNIAVEANALIDSYCIYSKGLSHITIADNEIEFIGNTDGTVVNNCLRIEGDDEKGTPAASIVVSGNFFDLELPSVDVCSDPETYKSEVMSEGIVFYYCEDLEFIENDVGLKYNDHSSAYGIYDTLYAVSVRSDAYSFGEVQSSDILIADNTIELEGYGCAYAVYVCADDFEISGNDITVVSDANLAHGIDVDGPSANGAVVENDINVVSPFASYGVYGYAYLGAVEELGVIDNTISADGYASAGIELKVTDPVVTDNTIVVNGNYTNGIIASVIVDEEGGVISGNNITVLGSNVGVKDTGDLFMTKNSIGISVKGTSLIEYNTIESTNIGINLVEDGEFTINGNSIATSSKYYANGIDIEGSAVGSIDSNIIQTIAPGTVYPIYGGMAGEHSAEITKNEIYGDSYFAVGIEFFGSQINATDNTIHLSGNYTIGIGVNVDELIAINNTIVSDASNAGNISVLDSIGTNTTGIKSLNGTASIIDNEILTTGKYSVDIADIEGTVHDNYLISEKLLGDNSVYSIGHATVYDNYPDMRVTLIASDMIKSYGDGQLFNVTAVDENGEPIFNITLYASVDELLFNATTDKNGVAEFDIELPEGNYTITAQFYGDRTYTPQTIENTFVVKKPINSVVVSVENVTYGTPSTVKIAADVDGNYTVNISDEIVVVEVKSHEGHNSVDLDAGMYSTVTAFDSDVYDLNITEACFEVEKAETSLNISIANITYPDVVEGIVYAGVDGEYNVSVGTVSRIVNVKDGIGEFDVGVLDAGNYTATVTFNGTDNYRNNTNATEFSVDKGDVALTIQINNCIYPDVVEGVVYASVDGKYNVTIGTASSIVNVKNGIGEFDVGILDAGNYTATVTFNGTNNYNENANATEFSVEKADVALTIHIDDCTYPDVVEGIVYASVDGEYNVSVGTVSKIVNVENGIGEFDVGILDAGNYTATVTFNGTNNYNENANATEFSVEKADVALTIHIDDCTYPVVVEGVVYASVGGEYNVSVGTVSKIVNVKDGIGEFDVGVFDAGNYTATVTFNGTNNYKNNTNTTKLTVEKADVALTIQINNCTYPDEIEVDIHASVDGEYVIIVGQVNTTVNVVDNEASKIIGKLDAGEYEGLVIFNGNNNYNNNSNSTLFKVDMADPVFEITVDKSEFIYGDSVTIRHLLSGDATGFIIYYMDDGTELGNATVNADYTLYDLDAGNYSIVAVYKGDINYNNAFDSLNFTIGCMVNYAAVSVENVTYGAESIIRVVADADGEYMVDVNGTLVNVSVNNGVGNKSIYLDAGSYYVNVSFDNKNYNTIAQNTTFTVYKGDVGVVLDVYPAVYLEDVKGIISAGIDGEYNLTFGDNSKVVVVADGLGEFNLGVLDAGDYLITATYPGDKNYNLSSDSANITVLKYTPNITLEISDIDLGDVEVITITSDVPGSVNVTVNNITETLQLNGQNKNLLLASSSQSNEVYVASLSLSGLKAGSYHVTVAYDGDDNIESVTVSDEFTVNRINATMDVDAGNIRAGDNEVITVTLPDDATGNVTVSIDGNDYSAPVENGIAVVSISGLKAGDKTALIKYSGDGNYNPYETAASFTVNKAKANMSVDAGDIKKGDALHIVVNLPEDATGTVTVTVDGKNYTKPVKNGKAVFDILGLAAGKHSITVNYSGDDKYDPILFNSTIVVNGTSEEYENQSLDKSSPTIGDATGKATTGNPIVLLVLVLMTIGFAMIGRLKK